MANTKSQSTLNVSNAAKRDQVWRNNTIVFTIYINDKKHNAGNPLSLGRCYKWDSDFVITNLNLTVLGQ